MKAILIIAPKDFRDEEFFHTKEELERAGIKVDVASSRKGEASGMLGGSVMVGLSLDEVKPEEYDALIFVGGSGSSVYFDHRGALSAARRAHDAGRVVGAICIAPVILANAGILRGKRATVWDGDFVRMIERGGAKYTGKSVEIDGRTVTANGPSAAREFGRAIARLLKG
ncbi:MAG: DJ-1/PfpI family protein [Candidatus Hadarchaeales archaeon]